ncbi:STAS domain-containing protein [Roseibium sp. Sym1]|uniref:STAS domain-containing protein n=1 Tax=Roseibium sp. Sym1 TaxID=3016006 RepID=UPI0022B317AA|nr:STAS domain-containing protein [Roseibium sp. Sym1]
MEIAEHMDGGVKLLSLNGRLDGSTSEHVTEAVLKRVPDTPVLVLDLHEVTYISSAGLRVLIIAAKAARGAKTRLMIAGPTERVSEVLKISGIYSLLEIHPDRQKAVAAARK